MCEFALGCVNEMWVWCMCDILRVREQSIDVRCNVLVKVLNHQVMIWIFEMFIGCIYYSIDVRYQVIFTKCVHAIWWAVLCVSVCACVNMRCEMCELPFCVVICWSHRIYHCHLMEPSSWIIGASRANFRVLPVIGCVCIISRAVHRSRPMSLLKLMMGVFDVLRSPARGWSSSYSISVCQYGSFIGCTWCDRLGGCRIWWGLPPINSCQICKFGSNVGPSLYIPLTCALCHARQSSPDGVRDVILLY